MPLSISGGTTVGKVRVGRSNYMCVTVQWYMTKYCAMLSQTCAIATRHCAVLHDILQCYVRHIATKQSEQYFMAIPH